MRMASGWLSLIAGVLLPWAAAAQDVGLQPAAPAGSQATAGQATPGGTMDGPFWERSNLFGDPGQLRSQLAAKGLTFGLLEQAEVLGNPSGGTKRGVVFEGLLAMGIGLDTEKAGLWSGGVFNASAYQIHGRGLSVNNLDNNANTVSSLEAGRATTLFELWYEQTLLDKKLSIRVGQLAADQEFLISQYGGLFINSTFGWPTLAGSDLPSGGPAYPYATPGVRVRAYPREDLAVLVGAFNGDPAGFGIGTTQSPGVSGTAFRLHDGVFVIGEVQYSLNSGERPAGLPGTYKLGAWYNSDRFHDQRTDASTQVIPGTIGRARQGDWSIYAIADQLVWLRPETKDQGIAVFGRVMGAPGDRNLVNFYLDAGVTWKGVLPSRGDDTVGLGFGLARISDTASKLDSDTRSIAGSLYPIRRHESVLELTYQAQLAPWWTVQPTAQYVFNINGGVLNPVQPAKRVGDAAVLGVRTGVTF